MARRPRDVPPAAGVDHAAAVAASEQEAELRHQLATAGADGPPAAGALLGLPILPDGDLWVDIAGAAVVANRKAQTITSYLSRRTPKTNPFPSAHRYLYRLYWPLSEITRWRADQDAIETEEG